MTRFLTLRLARHSLLAGLLLLIAAARVSAAEQASGAVADVTAVSVFIDKGLDDGLAVGAKVELVRDGSVVATYVVTDISSKRAVCSRGEGGAPVAVGDVVRFDAKKSPAPSSATNQAAPTKDSRKASSLREYGIRGRIGASYLTILQHVEGAGDYRQPSLDLRVDGTQVGGAPIDFNIDVRTRRTYRGLASGETRTDGQTRLYRASLAYARPGKPLRVTLGRQAAPSLAMVSLFDGALAEYRQPTHGFGLFAGLQPDPVSYGLSTDVREFGGYYEWTSIPTEKTRWALTTGAVSSQEDGEVNRDFMFVQGRLDHARYSLYASTEADFYRGWREEVEGTTFDMTSLFLTARARLTDQFSLRAGFDNRRSVRLYRDIETPETAFDDAFRRGYWAGFEGNIGDHLSIAADGRQSDVSGGDSADSYSGFITLRRLTKLGLDARLRSTRYTNERVEGWLHSLSLSAQISEPLRLEVHGGTRNDDTAAASSPDTSLQWYGFEADIQLSRHWFFMILADRNSGTFEENDQIFITQSYRF